MGNPLLDLTTRPWATRRGLRRVQVPVPTEVPATDAVFLVLRRMRLPLVLLIGVFTISVFGLMIAPGRDPLGQPYRLSVFEAFYVISYTATTIGFGEIPYSFTAAQRLWVTISIYASVIGWAYSIGTLFSLVQDTSFRDALALQRFGRQVRRMREPFRIVAGYGNAGRVICRVLDASAHRVVVIDSRQDRIDQLATDQLAADAPGISADISRPAMLGLAGLGHRDCAGVLAVTNDNNTNLNIVMAVHLLRPDLPVIARCTDRATAEHMMDFSPQAVINPYDRYGDYLVVALRTPSSYRLLSWLLSEPGDPVPATQEHLRDGRWIICADDAFGKEVAADLESIGLQVDVVDPRAGDPDVTDVRGLVAGTSSDTFNLAVAAHARRQNHDIFLSVRQESHVTAALLAAFDFDSVFVPTELVAKEALARVATPIYWSFIEHCLAQDDAWAEALIQRLLDRCGKGLPETMRVMVDREHAPAVRRWLRDHELSLGDLLRSPDDRDRTLPVVVLALVRPAGTIFLPDESQLLREGDTLLVGGKNTGLVDLGGALFYDATLTYVATGQQVPHTWVWRKLTGAVARRRTDRTESAS
ncbi:MAG: NAD-binding protein [Actinomycetales bacterium]